MNRSSIFCRICRTNVRRRYVIILSNMGQIIIEIPQNEIYIYEVHNEIRVKKLITVLEEVMEREKDEEEDILGLWTESEPIKRAAKQK